MSEHNRSAAFLEYCRGTPLEEISHALAIPFTKLCSWRNGDKWDVIRPDMPVELMPVRVGDGERQRERILENRERNLVIAQGLQEDVLELIGKLRAGKLKTLRTYGTGKTFEVEPSVRDRADLAHYANEIARLSYRALGDIPEMPERAVNPTQDGPVPGQITIILPSPVAEPRRVGPGPALDIESEVVREDAGYTVPSAS